MIYQMQHQRSSMVTFRDQIIINSEKTCKTIFICNTFMDVGFGKRYLTNFDEQIMSFLFIRTKLSCLKPKIINFDTFKNLLL